MNKGQSLILLLVFVSMALTITVASIFMMSINSTAGVHLQNGIELREHADSAAENALLNLIRNPSYTGETYTVEDKDIEITVLNGLITATATSGNAVRAVEVSYDYTDNELDILSWKEAF